MKPSKDISRLLEIMAALRTPDTGCPWDLEQDFSTIAPYTIEEAYEVADAIERGDMEDLRLELGDLLLQSVYHARMAEEAGAFDFGDVVEGITEKMVRRHPHVFGTADVSASEFSARGMAEGTWERIKAEEKLEQAERRRAKGLPQKTSAQSLLDDVPASLPALTMAEKLQRKAAKVGFDWNDPALVAEKITEELSELRQEVFQRSRQGMEEELGDLLFTIVNWARHLGIDPEQALRRANGKFRHRFGHIERTASSTGQSLNEMDLETMEALWQEAKQIPSG